MNEHGWRWPAGGSEAVKAIQKGRPFHVGFGDRLATKPMGGHGLDV